MHPFPSLGSPAVRMHQNHHQTSLTPLPQYHNHQISLTSFPNELLAQIFRRLSFGDAITASGVCRRWHDIIQHILRTYQLPVGTGVDGKIERQRTIVIGGSRKWNPLFVEKYLAPRVDTICVKVKIKIFFSLRLIIKPNILKSYK